ncbi:chaperonin [Tetrabaena socialis]|uniref:20 kDa chaperonin, chloroplastic n=1 Tax=Tetrabaena socialis TaxID=47790 RepID=A0A2J8AFH2_9CHLO|nr:chaperonin [Tetrabaena socialis]|eukprot:PNH11271.1 chaperonin [Tetrabaena socialis]
MQTCLSRRGVFGGHAAGRRAAVIVRAEAIAVPAPFAKVEAKGDRVLVRVAEEEVKTRGGILLPPSSIRKPTSGEVVGLGDGRVNGEVRPFFLQLGQTVVYSKFGFMYTDLKLSTGEEYILIRENDIIGIMPHPVAE